MLWWNAQRAVDIMNETRKKDYAYRLNYTSYNYKQLLKQNRIEEACIRLKADFDGMYIESYHLVTKDLICHEPQNFDAIQASILRARLSPMDLAAETQPRNLLLTETVKKASSDGGFTYQKEVFSRFKFEDIDWIYSIKDYEPLTYYDWLKKDELIRQSLFEQILIVCYIVFTFVFFSVLVRVDSIKQSLKKSGSIPIWQKAFNRIFSALQLNDLATIERASAKVVEENSKLQIENSILERSLEYTLLQEIQKSNQDVPFNFTGTVAKVDINGFSQVVAVGGANTSFELAIELEKLGCEILQRYDGLFEKTIGDEIVVVFRGEDSQLKAVAFMRDLMQAFSKLEFDFGGKKRSFYLKGSFATSEIVFTKRAAGYGFLGDAFTLTTRLMESITNRERNSISFLSNDLSNIQILGQKFEPAQEIQFKNMQKYLVSQCYEFSSFRDVVQSKVMNATSGTNEFNLPIAFNWNILNLFRSDQNLIDQLEWAVHSSSGIISNSIFNHVSRFEVREASTIFISAIKNCVETLVNNRDILDRPRKLSRLLASTLKLVPSHQWNDELTQSILKVPTNIEGRINAGIIELLMEKDPASLQSIDLGQLILADDKSFRTRGQILVLEARLELSSRILKKIINMIESENENESATGLFVASAVVQYYWDRRAAELVMIDEFSRMTLLIFNCLKAGKPKLSERLQEYVQTTYSKMALQNEMEIKTESDAKIVAS